MNYKHDYDRTLTRLNIILHKLYEGEQLSVKALAEEFNCSERTVQRDFNERLAHLYPIEKNKQKWQMKKGYKIERELAFEDELILDTLEKISYSIGKNFGTKALKLLSKIKNTKEHPIYAKIFMEDISSKLSIISLIEEAIENKIICNSKYNFENHSKTIRIKPLKIVNFDGFWYLIAFDANEDVIKKYYLNNIEDLKHSNQYFKENKNLTEKLENANSIWFRVLGNSFEVQLLIEKDIAKYIKRKPLSPTQKILKINHNGSIETSIQITHEMEIIPIIGYWMPHIKVIEPSWLWDMVVTKAKKLTNT